MTAELAPPESGAGSRRLAAAWGLAPEDAGGVAVELGEQVLDSVRRCVWVVDVEAEVAVAPVEGP